MSQLCTSYKQTTISSFFAPCKGPLKFHMSSFESCSNQRKKKKRSKKAKKQKVEGKDSHILIVEEIGEAMEAVEPTDDEVTDTLNSSGPLSPQIIFDGDEILEDTTGTPTSISEELESPSKRSKTISEQNENSSQCLNVNIKKSVFKMERLSPIKTEHQYFPQWVNIAITKSAFEVKTEDMASKTQKMNSYMLSTADGGSMEKPYVLSLKTIIDIDMKDMEFDLREGEEKLDGVDLIRKHLAKVKTIIRNSVRSNFEKLLFEEEKNLLISFYSLKTIYQFICCKLFTHQIKWYNPVTFIKNIRNCALTTAVVQVDEMLSILQQNGFILTDYKSEDLSYLLTLLKIDDIKVICKELRITGKLKDKQQRIDAILTHISKQPTLNPLRPMVSIVKEMVCGKLGTMLKISESFYRTFYKVHLMYSFANPELEVPQGVYKFIGEILYNNNIVPKYRITDDAIFETAEEFAAFYKAYSYKEEVLQEAGKKNYNRAMLLRLCEEMFGEFKMIVHQKDIQRHVKPGFLNRFTPGSKYVSALAFGIGKLSTSYPARSKLWLQDLLGQKHFRVRKRSLLYAQLAIIYRKHYKDEEAACKTLAKGLKDTELLLSDVCELVYRCASYMKKANNSQHFTDVLHLFEKAPGEQKEQTIVITGHSDGELPRYEYINGRGDKEYLSVEDFAIRHYIDAKGFHRGIHCEGALLNTLFHIFLWDIIYMDGVPGTFVSPIQLAPLDLYHADFYEARREHIDKRIENIKSRWSARELTIYIKDTWAEIFYYRAVIVVAIDLETIIHIVHLLGRSVVASVCERFAKQYDEVHAGLPDLFLWNDTKCKFVEVKGPGDRLSTKQKLWIQFLSEIGIDVEVCHVRRMGGRR